MIEDPITRSQIVERERERDYRDEKVLLSFFPFLWNMNEVRRYRPQLLYAFFYGSKLHNALLVGG